MYLLSTLRSLNVRNPVPAVELNADLVAQMGVAIVEAACLDDELAWHDFQLRVQAGATGPAEVVTVVLARGAGDIVELGCS